jgi:hypothetical protein
MWFKKVYCPGTIFISQNFVCFESALIDQQQIIPFPQVMKLMIDRSAVAFCIQIQTEHFQWWFSLFVGWNRGDEAFRMMEGLWKQQLSLAQQHLDVELHTSAKSKLLDPLSHSNREESVMDKRRADLDADGRSKRVAVQTKDSHELIKVFGSSGVAKKILNDQRTDEYRQRFCLPASERLMEGYPTECSYYRRDYYCEGELYLSANFLCFYAREQVLSVVFVVPLNEITNMEKENSLFGMVGNRFRVATSTLFSPKEFLFSLPQRDKHFQAVWQLWKFCIQRNLALLPIPSTSAPTAPLPTLEGQSPRLCFSDSEQRTNSKKIWGSLLKDRAWFSASYLTQQTRQQQLWQRYLALNGSGVVMLRTEDFAEICKRGVPDLFRGKIWLYGSGAMFKCAGHPRYFQSLLDTHANERTGAIDDIGELSWKLRMVID